MTDEISLDGKQYISSKRASEQVGYSQDYIGQLARAGHIDAKRIGGMWYVSMDSLHAYKNDTEATKPATERQSTQGGEPESLISFDGKDYISASRASKLTGYNQDYVGQLARAGKILSRQVGNRWYVDRDGILAHKQEKDSLLAAVQAESVGIYSSQESKPESVEITVPPAQLEDEPYMRYSPAEGDLLPQIQEKESYEFERVTVDDVETAEPESEQSDKQEEADEEVAASVERYSIPIRVTHREIERPAQTPYLKSPVPKQQLQAPRKTIFLGTLAGAALTVVIVLSVGISSFKDDSLYASAAKSVAGHVNSSSITAAAANAVTKLGDLLENLIAPRITYKRN